jgi:hypothetical protein
MGSRVWRSEWAGLVLLALAGGCSPQPTGRPAPDDEAAVRQKFAELQAAVKSRDAAKLWALLDAKSRADAEKAAETLRAAHADAGAEDKAKQEEALGLTSTELAQLTGVGFLKTKRFQGKYHELPDSRIDKVSVQGDNATVYYVEPDEDKEKLLFVRQDGQWNAWLAMPKVK